jgi:hypothetical protein
MAQRRRVKLSVNRRTEMWCRWKAGQSLHEIGRAFGKSHVVIHFLLARHGGIAPVARRRSLRTLTLAEREDIRQVGSYQLPLPRDCWRIVGAVGVAGLPKASTRWWDGRDGRGQAIDPTPIRSRRAPRHDQRRLGVQGYDELLLTSSDARAFRR